MVYALTDMATTVEKAIEEVRRGGVVIVADDEGRENESDMIMAAEAASRDKVAFFLQHTSGLLCAPMTGERCDALALAPMVDDNTESHRTAFTVSVDLRESTTTGISASDRSATLRALADPGVQAAEFARPGHVFPLRARVGGVLKRAGHTEAAVDLMRLAGCRPAGVLCEIVSGDKASMALGPEVSRLASRHSLPVTTVAEILRHRLRSERLVRHLERSPRPDSARRVHLSRLAVARRRQSAPRADAWATFVGATRCSSACTASA